MMGIEPKRCPKCGGMMCVLPDSDRTTRTRYHFTRWCERCGHVEPDSVPRQSRT